MLAGELRHGAVESVWEEIAAGGMTGILTVESGKHQWHFFFRAGALVGARKQGVSSGDRVVDLLLDGGVLRPETVRDALKKQAKTMKSCVELLMEEGHVPLILYSRALSAALRLYLLEVIRLDKGHYQFAVKEDLREDTGAKPLFLDRFNVFRDHFATNPRLLNRLYGALFSPVTVLEAKSFPLDRKTLFYSYMTQDRDLLDFLIQMGDMVDSGTLVLSRWLGGVAPRDIVVVVFLRFCAILLVAALFVVALVVEERHTTPAAVVYERAVRIKVALLLDEARFSTGERVDAARLVRGGLITLEEAAVWESGKGK